MKRIGKNEFERTGKDRIRQEKFQSVGEAYEAMLQPTAVSTEGTFDSSGPKLEGGY